MGRRQTDKRKIKMRISEELQSNLSNLRHACALNEKDSESKEKASQKFVISGKGGRICVTEVRKRSNLGQFGHFQRMGQNEVMKTIYRRGVNAENWSTRGREDGRLRQN